MAPAKQDTEIFLAQRLASNETSTRTKALKTLRKYISLRSQKGGFTSADLLKIWKGLFYCLWMQDKPLLQEELSDQISRLMHIFYTTDSQLLYFETFLQTIKREWNGIDRLRMDKFFQLIRFVFRQAFEVLKRREWEASLVNHFQQIITAQLLCSSEGVPDGLILHILDVYMTELAQIGSAKLTADQNLAFIDPFCKTMAKSKDRQLVAFISKSIFSTIVDQACFAVEDLMTELCRGEEADSDSDQSSEDEEQTVEQDELKMSCRAKKVNGVPEAAKSNSGSQDEILGMEKPTDEDIEPVLQFDYGAIADRLLELGSRKNTPNFNRTRMYSMVKIFRDLSEGVFPQNEDADKRVSSGDELFSQKKSKKRRKKGKRAEEGHVTKKHKASCEVVEEPSEADQMDASNTLEREAEDNSQSLDNKCKVQDDRPGLQKQVNPSIMKGKKRKGRRLKSDIMEDGEEAASEYRLISKDMAKELTDDDEGIKKHHIQKAVAEETGGKEQTPPSNKKKNGGKHKKNQTGKPNSECTKNIQHLEDFSDPAPLKKKKRVTADEESTASVAAVGTDKDAKAPQKSCPEKRPSEASPVEMSLSEDQHDGTACMLGKKTKHKKKIMKTRTDAKINTLPEKTDEDIQTQYISSDTLAAEMITAEQQSSNTVAPLLNKKNKKPRSKGKTRETRSCGDVDMTSDYKDTKINYIDTEKADAFKLSELRSLKKEKKIKCISSEEQELGIEVEPSVVEALCTAQANTVKQSSLVPTPLKKKKIQKRKMQLAECLTGDLNMEGQPPKGTHKATKGEVVELSTPVMPEKKLKMKASQEASFISFRGETTAPTPIFCKMKPKGPSTPLSSTKVFHTQSETKKVTFGLKNNKTTEFRKTDWSLLVSPVGSSRVAFDPKKMPVSGVLKSPTLSPAVSMKKAVSKRRPTAADFF